MGAFARAFMRALRVAAPLAIGIATDTFENHPETIGLVPVVVGFGKWFRDKWPGTTFGKWFPF